MTGWGAIIPQVKGIHVFGNQSSYKSQHPSLHWDFALIKWSESDQINNVIIICEINIFFLNITQNQMSFIIGFITFEWLSQSKNNNYLKGLDSQSNNITTDTCIRPDILTEIISQPNHSRNHNSLGKPSHFKTNIPNHNSNGYLTEQILKTVWSRFLSKKNLHQNMFGINQHKRYLTEHIKGVDFMIICNLWRL